MSSATDHDLRRIEERTRQYSQDLANLGTHQASLGRSSRRFSKVSSGYNTALARFGSSPSVNKYENERLANLGNMSKYRNQLQMMGEMRGLINSGSVQNNQQIEALRLSLKKLKPIAKFM